MESSATRLCKKRPPRRASPGTKGDTEGKQEKLKRKSTEVGDRDLESFCPQWYLTLAIPRLLNRSPAVLRAGLGLSLSVATLLFLILFSGLLGLGEQD